MTHPLETYLNELREAHGIGTDETSGYPMLRELLNAVGERAKPKVRCIIHPKNRGAGLPDGGLFDADQLRGMQEEDALRSAPPAHGAIEVKKPKPPVEELANLDQVSRYLKEYGRLLVTNYRQFLLLESGPKGQPVEVDRFTLANDAESFWLLTRKARETAADAGPGLVEFLERAIRYPTKLSDPQDVAWFLASYAREALRRAERTSVPALDAVRDALSQALGLTFKDAKGEHFFRSTLVQTLFYGVFSAWVLWARSQPGLAAVFDWRSAVWSMRVPAIAALFQQVATPDRLGPIGLVPLLDRAAAVLNRVDRPVFFEKFKQEHAVQYFYEPFLKHFDPTLRKQLGVWYTPPELVRYMVSKVDQVLKKQLKVKGGLANERVIVLDPCCGTGAFLVEVLKRISDTLHGGGDALSAEDVKQAAMKRVFGFELLPAPFVIAHLQLGILLRGMGTSFRSAEEQRQQKVDAGGRPDGTERDERAGVFLTNALTGWTPATEEKQSVMFPELQQERDAAAGVKRQTPILVIIGNPPYNGFAGVAIGEERELSKAYRTVKKVAPPKGHGLNELFVRFFRAAERKVVEMPPQHGVICFVSNFSWLNGKSHTGMRERFLEGFDYIGIDCLNGDSRETGKTTPTNEPDPSAFSTDFNRQGIRVGTAIATLVRRQDRSPTCSVVYRDFWGKDKLELLDDLAKDPSDAGYAVIEPSLAMDLSLRPMHADPAYLQNPLINELLASGFPGVKTSRDDAVIDIDRDRLVRRMKEYHDAEISNEDIRRTHASLMERTKRFDPLKTRAVLIKRGYDEKHVMPYLYRPFDLRWIYWEPATKLLGEKSPEFPPLTFKGNVWVEARQKQPKAAFDRGSITRQLADNFGNGLSTFFPLYLRQGKDHSLFPAQPAAVGQGEPTPNLTEAAHSYLNQVGGTAEDLFAHVVSVLHTPAYREKNGAALRQNWPRIPLPATAAALKASADLGRRLIDLLDVESSDLEGLSKDDLRAELRPIAALAKVGGGSLQVTGDALALTTGWGYAQGDTAMPGEGRYVERDYEEQELVAIAAGAKELGVTPADVVKLLGPNTFDIYLNDNAYWRNVPKNVWLYSLGGYRPLKKWLSYREQPLLGRALVTPEARHITHVARRIGAILLLGPALDLNYQGIAAAFHEWSSAGEDEEPAED